MIASLLTTLFFACSALCGRKISIHIRDGALANFSRLSVGWCLLGFWAGIGGQGFSGESFGWLFWSGVVGFGIGDIGLFHAYSRIGSRLTILLTQCLAAPIGALIEYLWLGQTLSVHQLLCSTMILVGVAIAVAPQKLDHHEFSEWVVGILFGILAAVGQAGGAILSRKAYLEIPEGALVPDGWTAAFQRICGGIIFTGLVILWQHRATICKPSQSTNPITAHWKRVMPFILLNASFGPALGVGCYQWALQTQPTGVVLAIVALTPVVLIPLSMFFENERPSKRSIVGSLLAVCSVVALIRLR